MDLRANFRDTIDMLEDMQQMAQQVMQDHDTQATGVKTGVGLGLGLSIEMLIAWATLIYFLLQIGLLLPKYKKMWNEIKAKKGDKDPP